MHIYRIEKYREPQAVRKSIYIYYIEFLFIIWCTVHTLLIRWTSKYSVIPVSEVIQQENFQGYKKERGKNFLYNLYINIKKWNNIRISVQVWKIYLLYFFQIWYNFKEYNITTNFDQLFLSSFNFHCFFYHSSLGSLFLWQQRKAMTEWF